jgi:hypothetical protein
MASNVRLTFSRTWVQQVTGIADPKVRRGAEEIAEAQRRAIPVSADGSHGRPAGYAKSRIAVRVAADANGRYYDIGSDATTPDGFPYPVVLDVGSRPHLIESHGDYPLRNARTGQVFGKVVQHPGTRPTYWCRGSMSALAGKTLR